MLALSMHLLAVLQGKMEKSFLTFVATYPTWQPPQAGRQMLNNIGSVTAPGQPPQQEPAAAAAGQGAAAAAASGGFFGGTVGQEAGLGPGAAGDASVIWQHPAGVSNSSTAGLGQQQQGGDGGSSLWLGVADQPAALRHPNYQQQQHQHVQQQRWQQRAPPAAVAVPEAGGDMGAGLGGLGCGPGTGLDGGLLAARQVPGQQQQQPPSELHIEHEADEAHLRDLAVHLFGPLSPKRSAGQQQQQRQTPLDAQSPASRVQLMADSPSPSKQQQQLGTGRLGVRSPPAATAMRLPPVPPLGTAAKGTAGFGSGGSSMLLHRQQQHHQHLPPPPAAASRLLGHSRQYSHQQQQHQHIQQQQLPTLHKQHSAHLGMLAPSQQLLQLYPSTLYPGGPSAAAALLHMQQPSNCSIALHALGASLLAQSAAGSDFLPMNETDDLPSRVAASQSLLQSFYESQDLTVQHRQCNRIHARSVMLGLSGSAAAEAAAMAAMAAASASHSAVPAGEW